MQNNPTQPNGHGKKREEEKELDESSEESFPASDAPPHEGHHDAPPKRPNGHA